MKNETTREIVIRIEERTIEIQNKIVNIDKHLERLNNSQDKQDEKIADNKNNITWVITIGGGIIVLILIPILLKVLGAI